MTAESVVYDLAQFNNLDLVRIQLSGLSLIPSPNSEDIQQQRIRRPLRTISTPQPYYPVPQTTPEPHHKISTNCKQ